MAVETITRWEYASFIVSVVDEGTKVISVNGQLQNPDGDWRSVSQILNQMGAEGWELTAINTLIPPSPNAISPRGVWEYLLKRPREALA